jgi:hypothetical protein
MKVTMTALLALAALAAANAQTVGMVTQVQGNVQLTLPARAGAAPQKAESRAALLADVLYEGGEVQTRAGAAATLLYCPRSVSLRLAENSSVAFRAGELKTKGNVSSAPVKYCFVPQAAVSAASTQQAGMVAVRTMADELSIISPGPRTRVLPAARFAWNAAAGATAYTVAVETEQRAPVWQAALTATSVEMPVGRALAPGGAYRLRVAALAGGAEIASAAVAFHVLPKEEAQSYSEKIGHFRLALRLPSHDATPHLQLALIYEELEDFGAAALEYQEALRFGDSEFIRARLAALGFPPAAEAPKSQ